MKNAVIVSCLIVASFFSGNLLASAQSRGDDAVIQRSGQETVITGDGNRAGNTNTQRNDSGRRNSSGSTGTVQDNNQVCDIQGNSNECKNKNLQENRTRRN